jgi:predicted ABC-class ATPase
VVNSCHISPFIRNLPNGKDTDCFSTSDASGSTSMAASCVEAIELLGGQPGTILLDEDGCAGEQIFLSFPMEARASLIQELL